MKPMWCAIIWCSASYAPTTSTRHVLPSSRCSCWQSPGMRTRPAPKSRRQRRRRRKGRHRPKLKDSVPVHFAREGCDWPSCLILYYLVNREGRQKPFGDSGKASRGIERRRAAALHCPRTESRGSEGTSECASDQQFRGALTEPTVPQAE